MEKALVTGTDRGLGLAFTDLLLREGWEVFAGQYMPGETGLAALAQEFPDRLHITPLDVSSDESVDRALATVSGMTDSLNLIANIAGIMASTVVESDPEKRDSPTGDGTIFDPMHSDALLRLYNVNTLGPMRVTNRFVNLLLKGEGDRTLVNISSEAGSIQTPTVERDFLYGYCMSKTAVNLQSKFLQRSLAPHGVRVFNIEPGYMKSFIITGTYRSEAAVECADSERGIYRMIRERRDVDGDIYFRYNGEKLEW